MEVTPNFPGKSIKITLKFSFIFHVWEKDTDVLPEHTFSFLSKLYQD